MREHNKAFCRLVAEAFDCPGPVLEFGAYQVEGQEGFADLRGLFGGADYLGCDMRDGPGVDRVEDVTKMSFDDGMAGTILCLETFEHVFAVHRAFDEVFRVLRPGGLFVLTSPFHFRIHGYPDDYWRMTPSCLRRMLEGYDLRVVGQQGSPKTPHTVMSLAIKGPAAPDAEGRARRLVERYHAWLRATEAALPAKERFRRGVAMLHRSKAERAQIRDEYRAAFTVDVAPSVPRALAG